MRTYRRPEGNSTSPFVPGKNGFGPSTHNWSTQHLEWLQVDFTENVPLSSKDDSNGLFPETKLPPPDCALRSLLRARLGLSWDDIWKSSRHDEEHYNSLRDLAQPVERNALRAFDQSSAIAVGRTPDTKTRARLSAAMLTPTRPVHAQSKYATSLLHHCSSPPAMPIPDPQTVRPTGAWASDLIPTLHVVDDCKLDRNLRRAGSNNSIFRAYRCVFRLFSRGKRGTGRRSRKRKRNVATARIPKVLLVPLQSL